MGNRNSGLFCAPHNGLEQHDDNGVESDLGGGLNYLNVVGSSV